MFAQRQISLFIISLFDVVGGRTCSLKEKYKKDCEIAYPQSNKEFKI